jgi:putative FmdB family regulatory protein
MPIYEYECSIHGNFEHNHSIKDVLEKCPQCQEENIESDPPKRLISLGSFILNGGCWARDKYSK